MPVIPHLVVNGADGAAAFYAKAFGAEEVFRMPHDDGRLLHVEMNLAGGKLFLCDEFPEFGGGAGHAPSQAGSSVTLHVDVENCDAAYARAVEAGATGIMPPENAFWGDRYAKVRDPFGHVWSLAHPLSTKNAIA
jgi:PhnB protein